MNRLLASIFTLFLVNYAYTQESKKLVGFWKFSNVLTTNPKCKDVNYFPITSFNFRIDGSAEFKSAEGTANAKYRVSNDLIELTDLSENGVKQEGSAQFEIKNITEATLTLKVEYECGSIDIIFKK